MTDPSVLPSDVDMGLYCSIAIYIYIYICFFFFYISIAIFWKVWLLYGDYFFVLLKLCRIMI